MSRIIQIIRVPGPKGDTGIGMSAIADQRLMGNVSGATATPAAITPTQAKTMLGYRSEAEVSAAIAAYAQPLDSDLTSIAGLVTQTFGRSLLTLANEAAARSALQLAAIAASGNASDLAGTLTKLQQHAQTAYLDAAQTFTAKPTFSVAPDFTNGFRVFDGTSWGSFYGSDGTLETDFNIEVDGSIFADDLYVARINDVALATYARKDQANTWAATQTFAGTGNPAVLDAGNAGWFSDGETAKSVNNGREFMRLAFDSGIRGIDRNGANHHLLRVANVPGIDGNGTYDFAILGGSTLDFVSVPTDLDLVGNDIVDMVNIGNTLGSYSPRLIQGSTDPSLTVGIATTLPGGALADRLVFSNNENIATATWSNTNVVMGNTLTVSGLLTANDSLSCRYGLKIKELATGDDSWLLYRVDGGPTQPLYLRDMANSRTHASFTPSATSGNAITELFSTLFVNGNLTCGPTGEGRVLLVPGGGSAIGYVAFVKPNGTRQGYIGSDSGNNISFTNEQSGIFSFNKGATFNGSVSASGFVVGSDVFGSSSVQAGLNNNGKILLFEGGTAATGYLAFLRPNNTRQGYIGFDGGNDISFTNEQNGIFAFNRGATFNGSIETRGIVSSDAFRHRNSAGEFPWMLYSPGTDMSWYVRDMVNARMQMTFSPGASASAALTQIHSQLTVEGAATLSGIAKLGDFTVGTLPSAVANAGYECNVTDSSVTTFGSTVAGGGSSRVKLYSNGTNWTVQAA